MKRLYYVALSCCFMLLFSGAAHALGIGAWQNDTPGGSIISHDPWSDSITLVVNNSSGVVEGLTAWYFYKNQVIGTNNNATGYFVVDEETGKIYTFANKLQWLQYRAENHLNPSFWTRWYSWEWLFPVEDLSVGMFVLLVIAVAISFLIAILIYSYKSPKNKNFRFWGPFFKITGICVALFWLIILTNFILSNNPQSI